MGALLSLPLLAVPSMGTVRSPNTLRPIPDFRSGTNTYYRFLALQQAVAVPRLVQLFAVRVGNVATGKLYSLEWEDR